MVKTNRQSTDSPIVPGFWRRLVDNRRFWICATGIVVAATVLPAAWRAWRGHDNDFEHYWNAALAMRNGQDIYTSGENRYVYPPLLAFLFQPLTLISERTAAVIWIFLSGLLIVVAVLITARESVRRLGIDLSRQFAIAGAAMILGFDKIRSLLSLGQSDSITLLGFACALRWMEEKPVLAGLAVGFSGNIKYLSLIFVPYFAVKQWWRAAISAVLFFLFFLLLPAVQIGFSRAKEYATAAFGGVANMFGSSVVAHSANVIDIAWNRSVSIPSTIFRFTRGCGWPDAIAVTTVLLLFITTIAILVKLRAHEHSLLHRKPLTVQENRGLVSRFQPAGDLLEWFSLIVLALVFSPQTTLRHMVLLVLAFVLAVAVWIAATESKQRLTVGLAIGLMIAALTLPPYGIGINQAVWTWRAIGGASWCALIFLFAVVRAGSSVAVMFHRRN